MNQRDMEIAIRTLEGQIDRLTSLESGPGLGEVLALHLSLPELRGFWPFSSVDSTGATFDLSGQSRTLTNGGAAFRGVLTSDLPYASFTGGSTSYFTRADEASLDITSDLTLGGWFNWNTVSGVNFFGKTGASGSFAYGLQTSGSVVQAYVSGNGTSVTAAADSQGAAAAATWYFYAMRYTHSSELAVFVNAVKTVNVTGIPASINNTTAALQIGGCSANSQFMNGKGALPFICATALSDNALARLYNTGRLLFGV